MPYRVKRIILKTGELVTERERLEDEDRFDGPAPVVDDQFTIACRGRKFLSKVIWGNWPDRNDTRDPGEIVLKRMEEI